LLSTKYLGGIPGGSRASEDRSLRQGSITDEKLVQIRALDAIARRRGQSLAQMALAWVLRDQRVTTALIGVRNIAQLEENLASLDKPDFSPEELDEIDRYALG
jgi:L-glyceraldehyde 3-phosphate reductase